MARLKRATTSFSVAVKDRELIVHDGELLPVTHPAVKARPELFVDESTVEQATAAPGEKRKR